jgi:murein DD-endopeptidase MepM/ murein hydrolase activator NlpD
MKRLFTPLAVLLLSGAALLPRPLPALPLALSALPLALPAQELRLGAAEARAFGVQEGSLFSASPGTELLGSEVRRGLVSLFPAGTQPFRPVAVHPLEIERGGVLSGFVFGKEGLQSLEARLSDGGGTPVASAAGFPAARGGRAWAFLLAVPSTLAGGEYRLTLQGGKGGPLGPKRFVYAELVRVRARSFPSERIRFDQALSRLMTQPDPQKDLEVRRMRELLETTRADAIWYTGGFCLPVSATRVSAGFADRRIYDFDDGGSSQSLHNGLDLAAPQGTPVEACGSGRVVLAESRILTGNSVVIEHLPGIYSLYYHLSEMAVSEGQWVRGGQRIGAVGMTGLATGPHLHWELRVGAQPVDPQAFIGRPLVDKALLFGIMKEIELDERG